MRAQGIAPNFQTPSRQTPSRSMWITIALCVFLPPIGLIRLWAMARCPLRGKLIISIIAVLSMTLMLTIFISARQPNPYLLQTVPDYGQQLQATPTQTAETEPLPEETPSTVIPANPVG